MGRPKKYNTEEERKAAQREASRRYYLKNKDKILEFMSEYYQNNKDKIDAKNAKWREEHPDYMSEYMPEYYQTNKEKLNKYNAEYQSSTPRGRATHLLNAYIASDKKYNRGESTITYEWIMENIFNDKCCVYCGEPNWKKLGCDRKDNSLPHTPDNVVPCCGECNRKKGRRTYDEYMRLIGKII